MRSFAVIGVLALAVFASCNDSNKPAQPDLRADMITDMTADTVSVDQSGARPWTFTAGGTGKDSATLALDGAGNIILAGQVSGTATFGKTTVTATGATAGYVAKLDAEGALLWLTPLQGEVYLFSRPAVDGAGNIYIVGFNAGAVQLGAVTLNPKNELDLFVAKLDASGKALWAVSAGGSATGSAAWRQGAYDVAVDSAGNATLVGEFVGTLTFGSIALTARGASDGFVARVDPQGGFAWAIQVGCDSTSTEGTYGVALDAAGNSAIMTLIGGKVSFGTVELDVDAVGSVAVAKLDPKGKFLWAAPGHPTVKMRYGWCGPRVAFDSGGNVYAAAGYVAAGDATENPFVAKFDPQGKALWITDAPSSGTSSGPPDYLTSSVSAIVVNGTTSVTVAGTFTGATAFGPTSLSPNGAKDIFVAAIDSAGAWTWAKQVGGPGKAWAGMAANKLGDLVIAGSFENSIVLAGETLASKGDFDAFVWSLRAATP